MHTSIRSAAFIAVAFSVSLAACSKPENVAAGPADEPCAIVTRSEVREAFPGAETGKRDHTLDQYGMASCTWELPTSKLAVQTFNSKTSADSELRGRMLGFLDPLQPELRQKIRYDAIAGLGDEAVVVAVKADQAAGVLADAAMLGIRRGERMAVLFTSTLVDGDPEATRKALEMLARTAAPRL